MRQLSYYVGRETQADELGQVTQYDVDTFGRITAVREHLGSYLCGAHHCKEFAVTSYAYDALDRLLSITDANKNETEFKWDALNRQRSIRDPDRGLVQFIGTTTTPKRPKLTPTAYARDGIRPCWPAYEPHQRKCQSDNDTENSLAVGQRPFCADRVQRRSRREDYRSNLQRKAFVRPSLRSKRPC